MMLKIRRAAMWSVYFFGGSSLAVSAALIILGAYEVRHLGQDSLVIIVMATVWFLERRAGA